MSVAQKAPQVLPLVEQQWPSLLGQEELPQELGQAVAGGLKARVVLVALKLAEWPDVFAVTKLFE